MVITGIKLKNWRNFREAEARLDRTSYVIGPNASGKSNFLDAFRFLRDVCKAEGGGLQKAIKDRGGIKKLRCLHHRRDSEVRIEVHLAESFASSGPRWRYLLGFKPEGKGAQRILITTEEVWEGGRALLRRPRSKERQDPLQLTKTHLEQTVTNRKFRSIVEDLSSITYLHLVPQLLKYSGLIGGNRLENDPFGQGFLERIARTPANVRKGRLRRIEKALAIAVPRLKELRFRQDELGRPHLEALYEHHRPNAGWQREEQFSDGTLRLAALLWSLLDGDGLLLLEEPELSLHQAIVGQVPAIIDRARRNSKKPRRQVLVSTHSEALLDNEIIDKDSVVVLEVGPEGTTMRSVSPKEAAGIDAGFSIAEVVLPQTRPEGVEQIGLFE